MGNCKEIDRRQLGGVGLESVDTKDGSSKLAWGLPHREAGAEALHHGQLPFGEREGGAQPPSPAPRAQLGQSVEVAALAALG